MIRYRQLTREHRYQLAALLANGESQAVVAATLGFHQSTISRELVRNGRVVNGTRVYTALRAQRLTEQRRKDKGATCRKIRGKLRTLVEAKLQLGWSPEQISGRLYQERKLRLSHETIYQHVIRDARRHGHLRYLLRHRGYGYRRLRKTRYVRVPRKAADGRRSIADRPARIEKRCDIGHWERDLVLSTHLGPALLVLVERKTSYALVRWLDRVSVAAVHDLTSSALKGLPVLSITNDNGCEFHRNASLEKTIGAPIYFTDPGKPWQRGSVENLAGLTRQYFFKRSGGAFTRNHRWLAPAIEHTLNARPRKRLKYRTPHEVFFGEQLSLLSRKSMHFGLESSDFT